MRISRHTEYVHPAMQGQQQEPIPDSKEHQRPSSWGASRGPYLCADMQKLRVPNRAFAVDKKSPDGLKRMNMIYYRVK